MSELQTDTPMDSKTGLEGDERRLRAGEDVETPPAAEHDPVSSRNTKARPRGKGLRLPRRFQKAKPGSAPGIEPHELAALPSTRGAARITCIDYCPAEVKFEEVKDDVREVFNERLREGLCAQLKPKAQIVVNPPQGANK